MASIYTTYHVVQSILVLGLVLIAQAIFFSKCGQTERQTDETERLTHADYFYISHLSVKLSILEVITTDPSTRHCMRLSFREMQSVTHIYYRTT